MTAHAETVGLLEPAGQISGLGNSQHTGIGAGNPGDHATQHAKSQHDGQHGAKPFGIDPLEEQVIGHEQALGKVDVLLGNHKGDAKGAQQEDGYRAHRGDGDGYGILFGGIIHVLDVYGVHFHTRVGQEDAGRKNDVAEVGKVGNQRPPAQFNQRRLAAAEKIGEAQHNHDPGGDDRAHDTAPF